MKPAEERNKTMAFAYVFIYISEGHINSFVRRVVDDYSKDNFLGNNSGM